MSGEPKRLSRVDLERIREYWRGGGSADYAVRSVLDHADAADAEIAQLQKDKDYWQKLCTKCGDDNVELSRQRDEMGTEITRLGGQAAVLQKKVDVLESHNKALAQGLQDHGLWDQQYEQLLSVVRKRDNARCAVNAEIARLRGRVATIRSRVKELCGKIRSSDCMLRGTDEVCQNMSCPIMLVDKILNADAGKPGAAVIAATEGEFADPDCADVIYELAQIVSYWNGLSLDELMKLFRDFLRGSAFGETLKAVDAMREARKG